MQSTRNSTEIKTLVEKYWTSVASLTEAERVELITLFAAGFVYRGRFVYVDIQVPRFVPVELLRTQGEVSYHRLRGLDNLVTANDGRQYLADSAGKQELTKPRLTRAQLATHRHRFFHTYVSAEPAYKPDGVLLLANMQPGDEFLLCPRGEVRYKLTEATAKTYTFEIEERGTVRTQKMSLKSIFTNPYTRTGNAIGQFVRNLEGMYNAELRGGVCEWDRLKNALTTILARENQGTVAAG